MMDTKQKLAEQATNLSRQVKIRVNSWMGNYVDFVTMCLKNENFVLAMNALLPFDNFASDSLLVLDNNIGLSKMGVAVMRVDLDPDLFSLGISLEIEESECNLPFACTTLLTGCMTLEDLRKHVLTEEFANNAEKNFEMMIDSCFYMAKN